MTRSLWQDEAPRAHPPLDGDGTADVAIAGAGIAGLAAAYALARGGARVIVLEDRQVAAAASGRNAGFVLAGVAENFVAACRRYGAERATRVWRATISNRVLLTALVRREAIDCDLRWNGSLQIAGDDGEWEEIRESARQLSGHHGVRVALLPDERAALYEDDGEVHPVRLVAGIARACEAQGVRIHEGTRVAAADRGTLQTARGTIRAGAVVLCTNAYLADLVPGSRVVPVRGQVLATAPLPRRVFERPAYAHRGYRYWRQTAEGRVVAGGWRNVAVAEETGTSEEVSARVQGELDGFLREHGIDSASVTHRWAGTMGFSHDALPYVGRRPDGLFVSAGFTGHGNAFAVLAGELIASLVRTGRHPDAELFDPERP